LSCTVHDRYMDGAKVSVSREKSVEEDDTIFLDTSVPSGNSVAIYLTLRAARRLFREGLLMCDHIEESR